jgi:F-type H+-transporting ATPase subunit delta
MAELSTIARPYAEALFQAASADKSAAGALDRWLPVIEELGSVAGHPEVAKLVGDPQLASERTFGLLTGLMKTELPAAAANFLKLVIDNGRIAVLPEVARQFRRLKNASEGAADCLIESAFPLSDQQVADLLWSLSRKFALKLKPQVKVVPELIGGVRISVDDHVLDSTVKTRLAEMQAALTAA